MLTDEQIREKVAQVWCQPEVEDGVMDVDLANAFVKTLRTLQNDTWDAAVEAALYPNEEEVEV